MTRAWILGLALLAGCSGGSEKGREDRKGKPIDVDLVRPERRDIAREVTLPVELYPWQWVALVAKVNGYVEKVPVDRGSRVAEGDLLATIRVPELEDEVRRRAAEVKVAEAEVVSAEADAKVQQLVADRAKALVPERAMTQQDADIAQARAQVAAAAVERAKARVAAAQEALANSRTWLAYTEVRAPFAGVVTERDVHPGAFVSASERTLLFRVVDSSVIRATIDVPEADAPAVRAGETAVRVRLPELLRKQERVGNGPSPEGEGLGGEPIASVVTRSADALDPQTRTLRVEADLANPGGRLLPRMYGDAVLTLERHGAALVVPQAALVVSGGRESAVLAVKDGRAKRIPVRIGLDDGKSVEVLDGLDPLEPVIAQARGIVDGSPVRPRDAK
jgi:RND family efflux transporter MFP subunit